MHFSLSRKDILSRYACTHARVSKHLQPWSIDKTRKFIDDLDLGYISAESSAGEEEFEEAYENYLEANNKLLIIGDDLLEHKRIENIIKLLALIKKYTNFELIVLNEDLEKKIFRVQLSKKVAEVIASSFKLLGINVPERM